MKASKQRTEDLNRFRQVGTRVEVECRTCGAKRFVFRSRARPYCGRKCWAKGQSITRVREAHPRWKGGKKLMKGYVTVLQPDGSRVGEHRLVAESMIGRKLLRGEVVHHINGLKTDNRPENLVVMTVAEHVSHHRRLDMGLRER